MTRKTRTPPRKGVRRLNLPHGGTRRQPVGIVVRREFSGLCGVARALGVGRTTLREALLGRTYSPEIIDAVRRHWPQLVAPEVAAKYDAQPPAAPLPAAPAVEGD